MWLRIGRKIQVTHYLTFLKFQILDYFWNAMVKFVSMLNEVPHHEDTGVEV